MESIFYVLCCLNCPDLSRSPKRMSEMSNVELTVGLSDEFVEMIDTLRKIGFDETPPYEGFIALLEKAFNDFRTDYDDPDEEVEEFQYPWEQYPKKILYEISDDNRRSYMKRESAASSVNQESFSRNNSANDVDNSKVLEDLGIEVPAPGYQGMKRPSDETINRALLKKQAK